MSGKSRNSLHPVFVRNILTFLLFSLVLLVLFIPVYRFIVNFTLENELKYIKDKLENGVVSIDSIIVTLNNAVIATTRDSRFRIIANTWPSENYNPYTLKILQDSLNSQILTQSLIEDIGIIFSEDRILTKQHIFFDTKLFSFYNQFFICNNLTYTEWLGFLRSNRPISPLLDYWSINNGTYQALTFSAPWTAANYSEEAILFATIPIKNLLPLIIDDDIKDRVFIRINDIQGNIFAESNFQETGKIHILKTQSSVSPLVFEIRVPDSLINEKMKPVKNLLLIFSVLIIFITVSTSLIFAHKNSEPLRQFLTKINTIKSIQASNNPCEKKAGLSIFKSIKQIFSDVTTSIITIDAKLENSLHTIEQQANHLKSQIFDSALQKGIYTIEEQRQFQSVFPDFPEKFRLADIRYKLHVNTTFDETLSMQLRLINMIRTFQNKNNLEKIYIQGKDGNTIILLISVSTKEESWHELLKTLKNEVNQDMDISLKFALSNVFEKPQDICKAWQQLQFIHVLKSNDYLNDMEQIEDIPKDSIQLPLNILTLDIIYTSLNNADKETACSIIKECAALLPDTDDELIPNIIYTRLSNMLMQMKLENPAIFFDINIPVYTRDNRRELFEKQFSDCFTMICDKVRNRVNNNITIFGQKIIDFINNHLYDSNLYITMISDHFNISAPTLQKLVKKNTGQTFLVYVENQRLKKGREMLSTGTYTINEVAAQCGFSITDSFYKAYKKAYGIPPSKTINKAVIK